MYRWEPRFVSLLTAMVRKAYVPSANHRISIRVRLFCVLLIIIIIEIGILIAVVLHLFLVTKRDIAVSLLRSVMIAMIFDVIFFLLSVKIILLILFVHACEVLFVAI